MDVAELVDAFVAKVNTSRRPWESLKDVPVELRLPPSDDEDDDDLSTGWRIVPSNNSQRVHALEARMGRPFPPSFRSLVSRYSFPAFEFGPVMFFANSGHDVFWELGRRLFLDPVMSPFLLNAGFIQIGNPFFYNYDPIGIQAAPQGVEGRIVQLDHEAILVEGELSIVKNVATSFVDLLKTLIARENV